MNAGGPPPPPPPPPIPGISSSTRLSSDIPNRSPAMNPPPAALAGAMMKEKKPFTYTPGGLDLSEINAQQNGGAMSETNGGDTAPVQSRSFRVLQNVLDHDTAEAQGPVHIPHVKPQPMVQQIQQPQLYQQADGLNNTAPSDQTVPEPKKYMGGNIPSRSFRMLQAMTDADDASDAGEPANLSEAPSPPGDEKTHAANQTPTLESSNSTTPTVLSPSLTLTGTNDTSSDSGISSPSKISPSYTTTKDSKVYRNVAPKITFTGHRNTHVVNSALSNSKDPSSPSSPSWKTPTFVHSPRSHSPVCQTLSKSSEDGHDSGSDSPRLMKIIRQEPESPQITERRYEGGHIPSRVFRHLQTEYPASSNESNELQEPKPRVNSKSPSPRYDGSPIPARVFKSLQNEANSSFDSDTTDGDATSRASSSFAELDEYYHNGMANTACAKDTVLKELTSQFDNTGFKKKPRAAPGKVFRYLQTQYDTPSDSQVEPQQTSETLQPQPDEQQSFGYRGSKVPSPSFRYLQNQYHTQNEEEVTRDTDPVAPDAPSHEIEPMPYRGGRIPGKTFKFLQENITSHPSVLQARK